MSSTKDGGPALRSRPETPHSEECCYVRQMKAGAPGRMWATLADEKYAWRDSAGGMRGRNAIWLRLRCNDPSCPATALVSMDDIGTAVARMLRARKAKGAKRG